jgi:hypothetical protein
VNGKVVEVKALNVQLNAFAADILRVAEDYVAEDYTATMTKDLTLQSNVKGPTPISESSS